uniref:Aldehyde dehydrogenase domain-containing protein n=1 Tax=Salix viminalis TaxID=40686 RepID=A0A6N2L8A0_SALVM
MLILIRLWSLPTMLCSLIRDNVVVLVLDDMLIAQDEIFGPVQSILKFKEKGVYNLNNYLQVKAAVTPLKNPAWL